MAGGVALNCVANSKIIDAGIFDDVWIQPAAGDAGGALGAALAAQYMFYDQKRMVQGGDAMKGSYLGPSFSDSEIEVLLRQFKAPFTKYTNEEELVKTVADILTNKNVVGWFQGRMEWGPRALGNRSILADARDEEMQKRLNLKIKYREGFRPFAPSVHADDFKDYFDWKVPSPYMLLVSPVQTSLRNALPNDYHTKNWKDKLYYTRSTIPAVTPLEYSARLQTVHPETNPRYAALLKAFKGKTNYAMLVNTSFNVRGRTDRMYATLTRIGASMQTEMDYLIVGSFVLRKEGQPPLPRSEQTTYDKD